MTPQEMADWLARIRCIENTERQHEIVAFLRQQPTDAQKIEALKLASDAGDAGGQLGEQFWAWRNGLYENYAWHPDAKDVRHAVSCARRALRLLGLAPETEP